MLRIGKSKSSRRSKYYYVYVYRSSVTGLFVSKAFAAANPRETFKQITRRKK
jgi:hypothetical protein